MGLTYAVPQVVAHRAIRMALAGPSPSLRDRREFHRMTAEKVAASYESWNAMLLQSFRANLEFVWSSARFFWFPWLATTRLSRVAPNQFQRAALAIFAKGVAPVHRRVVANAKRLTRAPLP
jgi:hypothetical protein